MFQGISGVLQRGLRGFHFIFIHIHIHSYFKCVPRGFRSISNILGDYRRFKGILRHLRGVARFLGVSGFRGCSGAFQRDCGDFKSFLII